MPALTLTQLNFHHLRSFREVAHDGRLTGAARRLRVAPSALSTQLRTLEAHLGEALFERVGRRLVLTDAGALVLAYADEIFGAGERLVATLRDGRSPSEGLRVGAVATLSRNFLDSFLKPALAEPGLRLHLTSGRLDDLTPRLEARDLDLVLSNRPVTSGSLRCRPLARQPVSLIGHPTTRPLRFPDDLARVPLLLPSHESEARVGFDAWCVRQGVTPRILAEVDDMALLRLLARDTHAVALLPSVVVRDELRAGVLQDHGVVPGLYEAFYAVTAERRFPHPLVARLLDRSPEELLEVVPSTG
jgi:LysR family transcriptional activator of nhaA